jgi:hypothetical protein
MDDVCPDTIIAKYRTDMWKCMFLSKRGRNGGKNYVASKTESSVTRDTNPLPFSLFFYQEKLYLRQLLRVGINCIIGLMHLECY